MKEGGGAGQEETPGVITSVKPTRGCGEFSQKR